MAESDLKKADAQAGAAISSGFSSSPFGCFSDITGCIITWICPCYMVAKNQAAVHDRECTIWDLCCSQPNVEFFTRQTIRQKYNMPEGAMMDCLFMYFLYGCVICQDTRELKARGAMH